MEVEEQRGESDGRERFNELLFQRSKISRKPSHDEYGHPFSRSRGFAQNQGSQNPFVRAFAPGGECGIGKKWR